MECGNAADGGCQGGDAERDAEAKGEVCEVVKLDEDAGYMRAKETWKGQMKMCITDQRHHSPSWNGLDIFIA
jgi:hypothetical protein